MNVHYLQHVPFEGLGAIKIWLDDKEHKISSTKFYDPEFLLPDISEIDALIVLGGPMGIYEESVYQWLKEEKVPGIYDIDTRELTKLIREKGVVRGQIVYDLNTDLNFEFEI